MSSLVIRLQKNIYILSTKEFSPQTDYVVHGELNTVDDLGKVRYESQDGNTDELLQEHKKQNQPLHDHLPPKIKRTENLKITVMLNQWS